MALDNDERPVPHKQKHSDGCDDGSTRAPSGVVGVMSLEERVNEALDLLTPLERKVLELRFGLRDGRTRTWRLIGDEVGTTREQARQISTEGLERLRRRDRGTPPCTLA